MNAPQFTEVVAHGPILKTNEDGSFSAVMAETKIGGWVRLEDYKRSQHEVAHLRKTCADFGVHPARVPDDVGGGT